MSKIASAEAIVCVISLRWGGFSMSQPQNRSAARSTPMDRLAYRSIRSKAPETEGEVQTSRLWYCHYDPIRQAMQNLLLVPLHRSEPVWRVTFCCNRRNSVGVLMWGVLVEMCFSLGSSSHSPPLPTVSHGIHLSPRFRLSLFFRYGCQCHFCRWYPDLGGVDGQPCQTGCRVYPWFLMQLSCLLQTVGEPLHECQPFHGM